MTIFLLRWYNKSSLIADLGCGTGRLTIYLANKGYQMVGIDPDTQSIKIATQKDKKQLVNWINGSSEDLSELTYDLVTMTSNVAQVFLNDFDWHHTLTNIYESLNKDGYLMFDTRNPFQSPWERWTKEETQKVIIDPITGKPLKVWYQFLEINEPLIKYCTVYENYKLHRKVEENVLIFRTREKIIKDLFNVGFEGIEVYGDWTLTKANENVKSFIFIAKKTDKQ
jgi:2-polyprenyl-3-methyl-5-hydroxy-6-metoxy-1,4-benzoquinol methylase